MRVTCFLSAATTLVLLCPLVALSRVGETETACQTRYGVPLKSAPSAFPLLDGAVQREYEYHGWRLSVAFVNHAAVRIRYSKAPGSSTPIIQDDEAKAILDGESMGGQWRAYSVTTLNPFAAAMRPSTWTNNFGISASLAHGRLALTVESSAAEEFARSRAAEKEKKRKTAIPKF